MFFLLFISFFLFSSVSQGSLESYLTRVKETHSAYIGAIKKVQSLEKRRQEADLIFSPELFSTFERKTDEGPRLNLAFQGDGAELTSWSFGFKKKTRYGLTASLSYESLRESYQGRPVQFFPLNDYYTNQLVLKLEQSLFRNAFGKKSRLEEKQRLLTNDQETLAAEKQALEVLVAAHKVYWSLAISQEILKTQQESTKRAKSILDYNQKRFKRQVVDKGEVLEAKAAYLFRKLELEASKDNLTQAKKNFESFLEGSSFSHALKTPTTKEVLSLRSPDLSQPSLRYLSEQKKTKALETRNETLKQGAKPELIVYGNFFSGDIDANSQDAREGAFSLNQPVRVVGLRLSAPLAIGKIGILFKGYTEEALAARIGLKRREQDERVEKDKKLKKFRDLQKRLILSETLEQAQKKKLENEKKLQSRGRSTTYKVLLFEQDYLGAQTNSLKLRLEILNIYADFYSFGRLRRFL